MKRLEPILERARRLLADATAWLARLSPRERRLVGFAAGTAAAFFLLIVTLSFGRAISGRLARIAEKEKWLEEVAELSQGYRSAQSERQALERRLKGPPTRVFSQVEELAKRLAIEIGDMNDRGKTQGSSGIEESSVEVNVPRVTVDRLVRLLNEAERGPGLLKVKKIRLRARPDSPTELDASITVSTYQLVTAEAERSGRGEPRRP